MALSDEKIRGYIGRLLLSRMRILCNHSFYGLLLMHMIYSVSESVPTVYTDGVRIVFGTGFLESLSESELDFILMHEIMHVVLQHCFHANAQDDNAYNIACDIVVNSNIMLENGGNERSIALKKYGVSMHLAPDGKEGHEYTVEQVYGMLPHHPKKHPNLLPKIAKGRARQELGKKDDVEKTIWDDHSCWGKHKDDDSPRDVWVKHFKDATEAIEIRGASNTRDLLPSFARRLLKELRRPQTDWRTILNDFIQEEITDYSFFPPDRRFADSPFYLPDFNEKEDVVEHILFMIDTSGSMSDDMVTLVYSEVKGAIDQFNGKLKGWLGFFDGAIIAPKPFENVDDFKVIKAVGGGGTDFQIIFEYVHRHMSECLPASIVILTDGYAPFPQERLTGGIPVLWLLNNEEVHPPWGKIARMTAGSGVSAAQKSLA